MPPADQPYVSRGGLKLRHALDHFAIDPAGLTCADLGCSTGGFTDCLLQAGAAKVFAVDTAYGELAWSLRTDPRVAVLERSNALHTDPPEHVDLVVIDLGWTRQDKAIPAAIRWLKPGGRVISLIKPHYEAPREPGERVGKSAALEDAEAERIVRETAQRLESQGLIRVLDLTPSPIRGGKPGKGAARGNAEWLALFEVA